MTLTSRMIADMRPCWNIEENLEALTLSRFGTEPHPHKYTEQGRYDQVRKAVGQDNERGPDSMNYTKPDVAYSSVSAVNEGGYIPETPF